MTAPSYPACSSCGHNASGVLAGRCTAFVPYPEGDPRGLANYCPCRCADDPAVRAWLNEAHGEEEAARSFGPAPVWDGTEVVHAWPPRRAALTPCCGRSPFDLPRGDRMTVDASLATCGRGDGEVLQARGQQHHRDEKRETRRNRDQQSQLPPAV